jgi:diguanylate cyclase (GGDEF)-like protein
LLENSTQQQDKRGPRLIVVSGMLLGHQIELGDTEVFIGRGSTCAIALPHPSVSRQHCRIWREDGRYHIEDLASTNRTYLNGEPIKRAELRDGDQISVGTNAIKFFVGASMESRYHNELIDLAIYDSLTGFYNRRHFLALLDEDVEKSRDGRNLCLLMLDLDHFKACNDEYGHLVGDQILSAVAQVIRELSPRSVPIGRLGGEEFALLLRGTALDAATEMAEALRAAVAIKPFVVRDKHLPVAMTMSIGVGALGSATESSALLNAADEQLYRAKLAGRNRVCRAD